MSVSQKKREDMNLNLHHNGGFQSLGMFRIKGTMPATKAIKLISDKLNSFDLNLDKDIVASVTDGASLMKKFFQVTKPRHQICYNQAVHLCVIGNMEAVGSDQGDSDDVNKTGVGDDVQTVLAVSVDFIPLLKLEYQQPVAKIRKLVKKFRRSPVSNDDEL